MLWAVFFRRGLRVLIFVFAVWVLVFTNYGLLDYLKFSKEIKLLQKEEAALIQKKTELARYVNALAGPEIDLALLEMQVRKILVYASEDEDVYFFK